MEKPPLIPFATYKDESGTEIGNFEEIRFRRPTSAQLQRFGEPLEVGNGANTVRINRIGL